MVRQSMKAVPVNPGTRIEIHTADIPAHVGTDLAQSAFEAIRKVYADPSIQAEYRKWRAEREATA